MKRHYITTLLLLIATMMSAQNIHHEFKDANLPDVLKYIDSQMKGGHVQFVYNDLDGIKVSHTFRGQNPLEAVRTAIGAYPIKVTEDEGDIYVEYDKSIAKDIVLDNVTVYGTEESVSTLNFMRRVMHFSVLFPQEKVYVHLDNTGYFMGETIWFKAYVTNAATHGRTDISQTLYVELINPDGEVLKTQKLYINNGEAEGSFQLENMYSTGFYEVRAYTRYMLNWGNATCFSRVIPIFKQPKQDGDYSTLEIDMFSYKKRHPSYREISDDVLDQDADDGMNNLLSATRLPKGEVNVHFYPEGGNLVERLPSRVAFTVTDSKGLHFDCKGEVVDEDGTLISSAVTYKEGRGYFEVTPTDEALYLSLTTSDGKKQKFALPEAQQEGMTLKLNTLRDDYVSAKLAAPRSMHNHLLGYTLMNQGRILACDTVTCRKTIELKFERTGLPAGVNQLTIFDADGHIQAERLFFICPPAADRAAVKISTPTSFLKPCGAIELDIQTKPNSSISLSATDVSTLPDGRGGNALTWMLLASDLKGYIDHPEYYFESDDREHRIDADLLMMVQGWRRYDWNLMSGKSEFDRIYPIEDALYVDGQIVSSNGSSPIANVPLNCVLYNQSGEWIKGQTTTDSLGRYFFKAPDMSGSWNMIFNINNEQNKKTSYHIAINRNFSPQPRYISPYETVRFPDIKANFFQNIPDSVYDNFEMPTLMKRDHTLPEVKVKAHRRIFDDARAAWENERHGQYKATIYYNVAEEVNRIIDRGEEPQPFIEWLYVRNPLFSGYGAERYIPAHEMPNIKMNTDEGKTSATRSLNKIWSTETQINGSKWKIGKEPKLSYSSSNTHTVLSSDIEYKGRPIIWVLNNGFAGISYTTPRHDVNDIIVLQEAIDEFPVFLEEIKSIYISEDPHAASRCVKSSSLEGHEAVTVFIYTHHVNWDVYENLRKTFKGGMRTHRKTYFNAYNEPETFQMDDYSVLPPMEDYRRTIYWDPNIKTDSHGRAHIKFYNNSSARQLYISAEGMDSEGNILVNE